MMNILKKGKYLLAFLMACWTILPLSADNVKVETRTKNTVEQGERFSISFVVNTDKVSSFQGPDLSAFEVLYGPSTSRKEVSYSINGQYGSNMSITYTYTVIANKVGTFTVRNASATVDGKQYTAPSVSIKVLPSGTKPVKTASQGVGAKDVFLRTIVNKTKVKEQEGIRVSYKMYSLVEMQLTGATMPDFTGFQAQEVQRNQPSWDLESYERRNYQVATLAEYILFPQQKGKQTIPSATYDIVAYLRNENVSDDPFEAAFGGRAIRTVPKKISSSPIAIEVEELPNKPTDFSGAVGQYRMQSAVNTTRLSTDDVLTYTITIQGNGNIKMMKEPVVNFPKGLEVYDPKVDNEVKIENGNVAGTKKIEYTIVPRKAGTYTIPATQLVYFDVTTNDYKTISSTPHTIQATQGRGSPNTIESFTGDTGDSGLDKDIRFIQQGDSTYHLKGSSFFGSLAYGMWYLGSAVVALFIGWIWRKRYVAGLDVVGTKLKRANKVAVKRLKKAEELRKTGQKDAFYDEVLRALWGYVSDKLNIPVASLNKETVQSALEKVGVQSGTIEQFMGLLNECEYAHYVSDSQENNAEKMHRIYQQSLNTMGVIDQEIKR